LRPTIYRGVVNALSITTCFSFTFPLIIADNHGMFQTLAINGKSAENAPKTSLMSLKNGISAENQVPDPLRLQVKY